MFRTVLTILASLLVAQCVSASWQTGKPNDPEIQALCQKIQTKIDAWRSKARFPGVCVGFVLADGRSAGVASGHTDIEKEVALKTTDRLLAGSVGKMFVAAALLQLMEEGKIRLDDPVSNWIGKETWFDRLPNSKNMTVRSLLNHTAGVPEYFEQKGFVEALRADADKEWTPFGRLSFVLDAKPPFPVGEGWSYSDTHYILAGMVFEKASGKPLFEEIDRRLLKPLQLTGIIASDRRVIPRLANGVCGPMNPLGFKGNTLEAGKLMTNPQVEWAGGGLATTPLDLAVWAKSLFEGKVLRGETLREMLTGVGGIGGEKPGKSAKYGLGVMIRDTAQGTTYGHGGWFPGYRTEVVYFPDRKNAIAVQFNTDDGKAIGRNLMTYVEEMAQTITSMEK